MKTKGLAANASLPASDNTQKSHTTDISYGLGLTIINNMAIIAEGIISDLTEEFIKYSHNQISIVQYILLLRIHFHDRVLRLPKL